jgi:nucleoid-associated protein YgaU
MIAAANPKVDPKRMKAGQVLNLPEINTAPSASATEAGHTAPAPDNAATPTLTGKTYKVVSGDSLRKIAVKTFGKESMWEKIYELNKKTIGSDPAKLRSGMVLQLPEGSH